MSAASKAIRGILRYLRKEGPPKAKELVEREAAEVKKTDIIDDMAGKRRRLKSNPKPATDPLDYTKVDEEGKKLDRKARKGNAKGETVVKYGKFGIE